MFVCKSKAQNLFDNAGFEEINICTEYRAPCAPESWFNILPATIPLVNARLAPKPILGNNAMLIPIYDVSRRSKPLVYTMLLCPLQKGKDYKLSFYMQTAGRKFYNIDIAFLQKDPVTVGFDPYAVIPDIKIREKDIVADIKGWSAVEYLFTATSDAKFMLIGNINSFEQMKYRQADGMNKAGMIYHFVDEMVLRPLIPEAPCKEMNDNKEKLWRHDLRHTEFFVTEEIADTPKIVIDTLVLPSVLFKTNSAVIDSRFAGLLNTAIITLSKKNIQSLEIIGHTDNRGVYEKNIILSQQRAEAVKSYLEKQLTVQEITIQGKADSLPISDNTTDAGRAANRRVEIIVRHLVN